MRTLLCLTALTAAALVTQADEKTVPLDKVPAPVMAAFKKRFPDAKPTEAAKEEDKGKKVVYEITFKEKGKNMDITITEAGVLTTIEQEIDPKELPKAVRDTLDAKYPKATYKMAEKVIGVKDGVETVSYYEALLEAADKKVWEIEINADGTIKQTEEKKDEKKAEKK